MSKPDGKVQLITNAALEVLDKNPGGLRFKTLTQLVKQALPDSKESTVDTVCSILEKEQGDKVYKPGRGVYKLVKYRETVKSKDSPNETDLASDTEGETVKQDESQYYQPFATWLVEEMGECSDAITFGKSRGSRLKWGTPDVVGTYKPDRDDVIQFPLEIISAEIKVSTSESDAIQGLGQAVAYLLFSNKVYLVLPRDISEDNLSRIDNLCQQVGIGLVLLDKNSPQELFRIQARPRRSDTDPFYQNLFFRELKNTDEKSYKKLRG